MSFSDDTNAKPKRSRLKRIGVINKKRSRKRLGAKPKKKKKKKKKKIISIEDSEEDSEEEKTNRKKIRLLDLDEDYSEEDDSEEDDSEDEEEEDEEEEEEEEDAYNDPRANGHVEVDSCIDGERQFQDNVKGKVFRLEQECKAVNINMDVLKYMKIVKAKVCLVFI